MGCSRKHNIIMLWLASQIILGKLHLISDLYTIDIKSNINMNEYIK